MFYGVAQDADGWWSDNVHSFIAVTPCIVPNQPVETYTPEPVVDADGNAVLDPLTNEPMYDFVPVYLTIE